ncbi:hypothetical protein N8T08_004222 [Aspergillus melleus]|uniref:Uncharacterized protein n=1 Tax=Aspergillus melleus TaxID=138277 RepID=A0ACC3B540_9EURO|nr:hypothetical protein N8T08_004222 [Aspergillus melleus]
MTDKEQAKGMSRGTFTILTDSSGARVAPCKFSVTFKNVGKFGYCNNRSTCRNDGNQYTKAGPAKRDEDVNTSGYYRLGNGEVIFAPDGASVGDLIYQVSFTNSNATMGVEALTGVDEGDEDEDETLQCCANY